MNEIVSRVTRRNTNNKSRLPLTISAQDGLIDQNTYFNKQVASKDMSKYYLLVEGDFAYNKSYSNGYPMGTIKRLERYKLGALSSLYIVFRPTNVNSDFLTFYYETNKWYREVAKMSSEGARNHGLLNIPVNSFFEKKLIIPSYNDEQITIAKFLKNIQNVIDLHQRRINILEELKKAYLKEMFVDQVNKLPNLRFKGFKEEWQLYKLGDLGSTFTGLQGKSKVDFGHGSGYYVPYTNIFNNLFVDTNQLEKIEIDSKQNSLKYGDVLFTTSSETPVEVGMSSIWLGRMTNVYLNSFCFGYRLNTPIDLYFLAFFLRSPYFRKKMSILAQGISRYNISKTKVMDSLISVPENTEQKYIGKFLVGLEKAIEFQNSKIKKIKELKKEYLNKMFI